MPEKLGPSPEGITVLLRRWRDGDADAESELYPIVLPELRRRATAMMRAERPGHTLQPTALIHEAWMRVKGSKPVDWRDRTHFFALAARIMRHILIDHARGHKATV